MNSVCNYCGSEYVNGQAPCSCHTLSDIHKDIIINLKEHAYCLAADRDRIKDELLIAENSNPQLLSRRDHFAAMAMQGILANPNTTKRLAKYATTQKGNTSFEEWVALMSITRADALIAELDKGSE